MTPKEKAKEIFEYYYELIPYTHTNKQRAEVALKASLKLISEVTGHMGADRGYEFWTEVKIEIQSI